MNKDWYQADLRRYNKIEVEDRIVCPYCFNELELHLDGFECDSEFKEELECEECGNVFQIEGEVRYSFWATTRKID